MSQTMDTLMDFAGRRGVPDDTMIEHLCSFLDQQYEMADKLAGFLNRKLASHGGGSVSTSWRVMEMLNEYGQLADARDRELFELLCAFSDKNISVTDLDSYLEEIVWC